MPSHTALAFFGTIWHTRPRRTPEKGAGEPPFRSCFPFLLKLYADGGYQGEPFQTGTVFRGIRCPDIIAGEVDVFPPLC